MGDVAMLASLKNILTENPDQLVREALGLSALVTAILAALFLPGLV